MVWIMDDGHGKYLGSCGVVSAPDEATARERIEAEMRKQGCDPERGYTLYKLKPNTAVLLDNGDY